MSTLREFLQILKFEPYESIRYLFRNAKRFQIIFRFCCGRIFLASAYYKALSTVIRFQTKTELFCSVFKTICVHTYRFRIVFARPHYNAVSVLKTLLYPQWAGSNELEAYSFQYIGSRSCREIEVTW